MDIFQRVNHLSKMNNCAKMPRVTFEFETLDDAYRFRASIAQSLDDRVVYKMPRAKPSAPSTGEVCGVTFVILGRPE